MAHRAELEKSYKKYIDNIAKDGTFCGKLPSFLFWWKLY